MRRLTAGSAIPLLWLIAWFGASLFAMRLGNEFDLPKTLASGHDAFGRELAGLVLQSSASSAAFAAAATFVSCVIGISLGSGLALSPSRFQHLGLRALEFFLAFPSLLIALALAAIRGPGWDTLSIALLIGVLPSFTRLIYLRSKELLAEDYVQAAKSLGARSPRIIRKHLMPHLVRLCSIKVPQLFAGALLAEATLSFLGVGAPIGRDTWGTLLAQGKDYLLEAPHIAIGSGAPLLLTILALQLLSERLAEKE